jgi:hypothetical protein
LNLMVMISFAWAYPRLDGKKICSEKESKRWCCADVKCLTCSGVKDGLECVLTIFEQCSCVCHSLGAIAYHSSCHVADLEKYMGLIPSRVTRFLDDFEYQAPESLTRVPSRKDGTT